MSKSARSSSGKTPGHQNGDTCSKPTRPYTVLARKYRPQTFDDLIGQDVMVRTLRNAFRMDRIAQAYMLTGVRGVGKTTTARILARALNYAVTDGPDRPSLDMPIPGLHCEAIMESRHVDVVEMDAASHTGIDDIREILEAVRYKPAYARYRVFIIDEVHMLSKSAFNGLLKTLEEPPPHVKFIFATTEIRKVPATILSRCQRFDLKRVGERLLMEHFARVVAQEGHKADDDALALLARAAEGSVRDGLSLLDQALALAPEHLRADDVRGMLGLASRDHLFALFRHVMRGDARAALEALRGIYDAGGDTAAVLVDLADITHALTRIKIVPGAYPADFVAADRAQADELAARLGIARLSLAWQMLTKGVEETARAARPLAAAEMVLIRLCFIADLPNPLDLINAGPHASAGGKIGQAAAGERPLPAPEPSLASRDTAMQETPPMREPDESEHSPPRLASLADVAALAADYRDIKLKVALEEYTELVQFREGHIELHLLEGAQKNLAQELSRKLQQWTGARWVISVTDKRGEMTLAARRQQEEAEALREVRKHPAVQSVFHYFPKAQITGVRPIIEGEANTVRRKRKASET